MTERNNNINWLKNWAEYKKRRAEEIEREREEKVREMVRKWQAACRHAAATGSSLYPKGEDE
tara:strand:- start:123 stop:308 length:186 start_codon:yes stop_codon:yes gene_type:complete